MSKKIIIEITDQEYTDLVNAYEKFKPLLPPDIKSFDDFCKFSIVGMTKTPSLDSLKNLDFDELLQGVKEWKDVFGMSDGVKKETKPEQKTQKDITPDDEKYKS